MVVNPQVSDHAVLRYLQREHGIPVEEIRELLAHSAAIAVAHEAPVVILGKVKLIIKDGVVVTVLRRAWKPSRRQARPERQER